MARLPYEFFAITMEGVGRFDTSAAAQRSIPHAEQRRPWVIVMSSGKDHQRVNIVKRRGEPLPEADV